MYKIVCLLLIMAIAADGRGQASDFITVKKRNNRTVKTFFPGVPISLQTYDKRQSAGIIKAIRNDSIFVREWDIRPMLNGLGIPVVDTVAEYLSGFHYKEIAFIDVSDRMKMQQLLPGRILIIGGTGYALLNVINGAYLHESITSSKNLRSLGIAAGAVGVGILTTTLLKRTRRYKIEYVRMNEVKKQLRGF
ncbi:MAG TPA: hypothetical protein VL307_09585 [Chitinophagaceae bacterium]|nr:hypothetical protein [Chitinophagaceae bacterium]